MDVPTLAVWKFASCDGCQLSLLDLEDELLTLAAQIDIANGVCHVGGRRRCIFRRRDGALLDGIDLLPAVLQLGRQLLAADDVILQFSIVAADVFKRQLRRMDRLNQIMDLRVEKIGRDLAAGAVGE